jgi:hypothetical protein
MMNNIEVEGVQTDPYFNDIKSILEIKESPLDKIVIDIANYIVNNNLKYLFQPMSWFDKYITLDTSSRRDDLGCDLCIQIRCVLSLACCCCANYIRYPFLMSRYNISAQSLYTNTDYNYNTHWKYLRFWNIDNLMKILGFHRKFKISQTHVGLDDITDGIDKIVFQILDENIENVKIRVYNLLVYHHFINGKTDEPDAQVMCC